MKVQRNQTVVYWAPSGIDGYGQTIFYEPVELLVRWEDKQQRYLSKDGTEHVSSSVVYPSSLLALGGYLWVGRVSSLSSAEEGDPLVVPDAKEIRSVNVTPALKGSFVLYEVLL